MRRALVLFGPVLLAGIAMTVIAVSDRNEDPSFALEQRRAVALNPAVIEKAVGDAPEPRPDDQGRPARSVRCTPGDEDPALRNPWRCVADYRSGRTVHYRVVVQRSGDWEGISRDGVRRVFGRIPLTFAG